MILGLTRGELLMVAFVSVLVLVAGQIPRIVRALEGRGAGSGGERPDGE